MRPIIQRLFLIKNFCVFTLMMFMSVSSKAQILEPVKWSIENKKFNDKEFEIVYTAKIDQGWHLYSQFIKPNGPKPTHFAVEKSPNFIQIGQISEEKGNDKFEEFFNMDVKYFKDKAVFVQKIKIENSDKLTIRGEIEFMSCNDETCVPGYSDIEVELK